MPGPIRPGEASIHFQTEDTLGKMLSCRILTAMLVLAGAWTVFCMAAGAASAGMVLTSVAFRTKASMRAGFRLLTCP